MNPRKSLLYCGQPPEGPGETENRDAPEAIGVPHQQRQIFYLLRLQIASRAAGRQKPSM
jgi:hypothetical protein